MSARPVHPGRDLAAIADGTDAPLSVREIIHRHHDALLRFLRRRLRIPEDAMDIAQETYIRMMQYEASREVRSSSALLYRIALNVSRDFGRAALARQADSQCSLDEMDLPSERPTPERELLGEQELELLLDAIEELPPKCRQVFLLSRAHQMTYPEIAQHCAISVKMVEKHISHALTLCMVKVGGCA